MRIAKNATTVSTPNASHTNASRIACGMARNHLTIHSQRLSGSSSSARMSTGYVDVPAPGTTAGIAPGSPTPAGPGRPPPPRGGGTRAARARSGSEREQPRRRAGDEDARREEADADPQQHGQAYADVHVGGDSACGACSHDHDRPAPAARLPPERLGPGAAGRRDPDALRSRRRWGAGAGQAVVA